ncbi:MAG: hypothetical protein KGL66_02325 [Alphaproteobacteria bacterium]|nr:hypothetical protein [Alphaproteobacteria bacterium]
MSDSNPADNERSFTALPKPDLEEQPLEPKESRRRRRLFDVPEGGLIGWLILWLLAAVGGALIVISWQWLTGNPSFDTASVNDRIATLETRVGQIAAGKAPKAAEASFAQERRSLAALTTRVDADEARLTALENAAGQAPAAGQAVQGQSTHGQPAPENAAALKAAIDKNAADLAQLAQQFGKLNQSSGAQLESRVATNEKTLAGLRSDFDTRGKSTADVLDKLSARLTIDEGRLAPADLAARLDSFALKADLTVLDARLAKLEGQDTAGLIRRASAVLALADFVRASEGPAPFASELHTLAALVPASPEIADLSSYARSGAPTVTELSQRFSRNTDTVLAVERAAHARNWSERLWFEFVNLVSVRRVGNLPGNDTEARVARAEFDLKNGNLAAAVNEVRSLDAPARAAAAPWLKGAEARLAIENDTRALTARIVTGLASAAQSGAPK